jgi:hypothetical protein
MTWEDSRHYVLLYVAPRSRAAAQKWERLAERAIRIASRARSLRRSSPGRLSSGAIASSRSRDEHRHDPGPEILAQRLAQQCCADQRGRDRIDGDGDRDGGRRGSLQATRPRSRCHSASAGRVGCEEAMTRQIGTWRKTAVVYHPCLATCLGGVSGGREIQGWRDCSHTAMVGAGKFGSAKLPMATATYPGKPSFSQ